MAVGPIEFSRVLVDELKELRKRRRSRGEHEIGLPCAINGDGGIEQPYGFNELLADLERRAPPLQVTATEVPDRTETAPSDEASSDPFSAAELEEMQRGLTGLALSGGGIRSASFCLGALQALDRFGVFPKLDFMSTVSGGGYIGACISSLYATGARDFPFRHQPGIPESDYLLHLRDYCNYLAPRGVIDYLRAPGLVLRGLVANLLVLMPFVLLLVALTIWLKGDDISWLLHANREVNVRVEVDPLVLDPERPWTRQLATSYWDIQTNEPYSDLTDLVAAYGFEAPILITSLSWNAEVVAGIPERSRGKWLLREPSEIVGFDVNLPDKDRRAFFLLRQASPDIRWPEAPRISIWAGGHWMTLWLGGTLLLILAVSPLIRWASSSHRRTNWGRRSRASYGLALLFAILLIAVVVETQPIAIYYYTMASLRRSSDLPDPDIIVGSIVTVAVIIGAFSGRLAKYTHYAIGRLGLFMIGALGPLVLWLLYIVLGRWALCGVPQWMSQPQHWLTGGLTPMLSLSDELLGTTLVPLINQSWGEPLDACFRPIAQGSLGSETQAILFVYVAVGVAVLLLTARTIDVNHTSLHQFYRDRLSEAFLLQWRPSKAEEKKPVIKRLPLLHNDRQRLELLGSTRQHEPSRGLLLLKPRQRRSWETPAHDITAIGPYHLINAAVNTQSGLPSLSVFWPLRTSGAKVPTAKGRNADFFLLSQLFVGSNLTGYCQTDHMRNLDHDLDLGTAMAISAAAAAPNMGSSTVKPLVFLMTVLNIRLGYWLPNPGLVADGTQSRGIRELRHFSPFRRLLRWVFGKPGPIYLLAEMLGFLSARSVFVNVSDGGHIENLGLYPLLQRRCRLIIAIDGERDPPDAQRRQKFSGLATAIRYARIDLGVDVNINLGKIGTPNGRHFAIGRIEYGRGFPDGWLIYIKSSLTGDENTYIREYGLDRVAFPHESTGDQFFDEKRFECYRALGYHAMHDFLAQTENSEAIREVLPQIVKELHEAPRVTNVRFR